MRCSPYYVNALVSVNPEYRRKLLALQAHVEQLIAEAEALSVGLTDDDILLRVSKQLAELRSALAEVEEKLRRGYDDVP